MSTSANRESEPPTRSRPSTECMPLLEAATKHLFRRNAFRITGLPVDATSREVARHADKLKMLAELGQDPHSKSAAFPMNPSPGLDEIREAIQRLKDPEKRLVDEFFWFWPDEFGKSQSDPAMQALAKGDSNAALDIWAAREGDRTLSATAKHNLALVYYVCALDWENFSVNNGVDEDRRRKITTYWKDALGRWETLATNDQFWEQVIARIRQLNEPNLPTGFARRMRVTLPEALHKINAEFALAFAEAGKFDLARTHVRLMRETAPGLDNVERTMELVLTPLSDRLKERIHLARQALQTDPATAHEIASTLIDHTGPVVDVFNLFFAEEEHYQKEVFDEVANVAVDCLVASQRKTGDNGTFVRLLERTLPLAKSTELRRRIEENIRIGKANLRDKELVSAYTLLKSIQDSRDTPSARLERFTFEAIPALGKAGGVSGSSESYSDPSSASTDFKQLFDSAAIVLRGISLDAWNNHYDRVTAVAANELAIQYAYSPELQQRLAEDKATLRRHAEDKAGLQRVSAQTAGTIIPTQRQNTKDSALVWPVVVGMFVVICIIGSCISDSASNSTNSTPSAPSAPSYAPPRTFGGSTPGGNVYRIPNSESSTLNSEKAEIESERATLEALEAQVERLGREIDTDRIYLDRTRQYAVDLFNAKVARYNAMAQSAKGANAAFNEKVDAYNAKLRSYGR